MEERSEVFLVYEEDAMMYCPAEAASFVTR